MQSHPNADKWIGHNLRLLRVNRRKTQQSLATLLGLHRPAISEVEAGRRQLSFAEAVILAHGLNVSIGAFADGVPID